MRSLSETLELLADSKEGCQKEQLTEQWLLLLQNQEKLYQMKLQRWYKMFSVNVEQLQKVINLRSIIPSINKCVKPSCALSTFYNNQLCENRQI